MNLDRWKDLIDVIGFVAIVASLVFVGMELRQSRAIAIGDGNLANAEVQIEANSAISTYSAIWVRGNRGETLSDQDTVIFQNLVRNKVIHAFMEHARLQQLEFDEAAELNNALFSVFLFENPGARQVWLQQDKSVEEYFDLSGAGRPDWIRSIEENLARLDRAAAK